MLRVFTFIFTGKPFVNISKQLQCVTYGNDITLHATVISSPPTPLIEWKKDDKIITDGEKFNIKNVERSHSSLSIHCLVFDDSGKYFIYVTNIMHLEQRVGKLR